MVPPNNICTILDCPICHPNRLLVKVLDKLAEYCIHFSEILRIRVDSERQSLSTFIQTIRTGNIVGFEESNENTSTSDDSSQLNNTTYELPPGIHLSDDEAIEAGLEDDARRREYYEEQQIQ